MKGIGAVIVTYNSEGEIGSCLDSAMSRVESAIVVDNASSDGTLAEVRSRPSAVLVANPVNRGFAAAVNQAIQALDTPYILLLNPDAVLQTGVEELAAACAEPGVGAAAGRLTDSQGRPQTGFSVRRFPTPLALSFEALGLNRIWPGNPVNRRYRCLDLNLEIPADVEQPAGAFLMIRRQAWQAVGGFDEGFYPIWFEDVDFLKRVRSAGFRVRYTPGAVAGHFGGHSIAGMPWESREACWYGSLIRYSFKHFRFVGRLLVWAAVVTGCALRAVYGVGRQRKLSPLAVYGRVISLACLRLVSGRIGEAGCTPALARQQSVRQGE
jgi:N-acetylglucosaminyl-diphospho-decaprenol L-rhamnosyltransferase